MTTLARTLGLRDLLLLIIGSVIGSGIFLVPGAILRQVEGSVGLALLGWLGAGVLSLLGALTYGELAAMNPAAGGLYVYIRDCFGRLPAFLYGWTLFLVIARSEEHTSELQSRLHLVCRLLLEKKTLLPYLCFPQGREAVPRSRNRARWRLS